MGDDLAVRRDPYWLQQAQPWAVQIAQSQHREALYQFGEYVFFILMWRVIDFEAGLVGRCPTCYLTSREAQAFHQSPDSKCPDCYGTTFEGGYRAIIVRPAVVTDTTTETEDTERGEFVIDSVVVDTTDDFTNHEGDYMVRADDTRYQTAEKNPDVIRSGFGIPDIDTSMAGSIAQARREDVNSIAYQIPVPGGNPAVLATLANATVVGDISNLEDIRGPLL